MRGATLELALPYPPIKITDPLDWAKTVLPIDVRPYIRTAKEGEVRVRPRIAEVITLTDIIAVTLSPQHPRNAGPGIQWPADVLLDGKSMVNPPQTP